MTIALFYSPGACSLVSHIALEEAGADYEAVRIGLAALVKRALARPHVARAIADEGLGADQFLDV